MFDLVFTSFGPLGSAALLLGMLGLFFVIATVETLALAKVAPQRPAAMAAGSGRKLSLRWLELCRRIARTERARDSHPCDAWSVRHCVRGERERDRLGA
jgi:hypothetical protein